MKGRRPSCLACLTDLESARWCLEQIPDLEAGTILPRSVKNFLRMAVSEKIGSILLASKKQFFRLVALGNFLSEFISLGIYLERNIV